MIRALVYRLGRMLDRLAEPSLIRSMPVRADALLPGVYAWATTVAVPVITSRAPALARATAVLALLALFLGALLAPKRAALGRWLGIHAFVALSLATWGQLLRASLPLGSDPLLGTLGALGWMLYAFGWGELRGRRSVPEEDPRVVLGPSLPPRAVLGPSVSAISGFGIVGALVLVHLAFRVTRPAHGVLAHAIALVVGLLLVGGASRVALHRGQRSLSGSGERLSASTPSIALLLISLGLGVLFQVVGR